MKSENIINYHIDDERNLIIGHAGTGRTEIIKELINRELEKGKIVFLSDTDCLPIQVHHIRFTIINGDNYNIIEKFKNNLNEYDSQTVLILSRVTNLEEFQKEKDELNFLSKGKFQLYGCYQLSELRGFYNAR